MTAVTIGLGNLKNEFFKHAWFLHTSILPKFLVSFAIYALGSISFLSLASSFSLIAVLGLTLFVGIILSSLLTMVPGIINDYFKNREQDDALTRQLYTAAGTPQSRNNEPSTKRNLTEHEELEEFKFKEWVKLLKHNSQRTRKTFIKKLLHVSICAASFALMMNALLGTTPKEVFYLGFFPLVGIWILATFALHRIFIYLLLISAMVGRLAIELSNAEQLMQYVQQLMFLPVFYFVMMIFMFGSLLYPTLRMFQFIKPGEADLAVLIKNVRGQKAAISKVQTQINRLKEWAKGNKLSKPSSMVFEGPPGVGKTMLAKALATETGLPFVLADGHAFSGQIMGFAPLIVAYVRKRTETLAAPEEKGGYGGAFVFIDEAENVFMVRQGMGGAMSYNTSAIPDVWDVFNYDNEARTSSCGLVYDVPGARERAWDLKYSQRQNCSDIRHGIFLPMGGTGGNQAIYPLMTWIDGATPPPFMQRIKKRKFNELLDIILPVKIGNKVIRTKPAKPIHYNIIFIAATNRAWMMDPAIRRAGRLGVTVGFELPDIESRKDIIRYYEEKQIKIGLMHPSILEKVGDFAAMTANTSPADIQQYIEGAHEIRIEHVSNLKRIKAELDSGTSLEDLVENDQKYWKRWEATVGTEDWDDLRANWYSLKESKSTVSYGSADPGKTSEEHKKTTAYHEFMGHLIGLKAFLGDYMKPTVLTIMPRRNALGMVAHVPLEERDPKPQAFYEGLIRVSIGSTVAERFKFTENQPGVSSDLQNATNISCFMIGRCGMSPYACSDKDKKRYIQIGQNVIFEPVVTDPSASMSPAMSLEAKILSSPNREKVALFLGQAFVDYYRLLIANQHLEEVAIPRLLEIDELSGEELEQLWNDLDSKLIRLDDPNLSEEIRNAWPDGHPDQLVNLPNPIYKSRDTEIREVA